MTTPLYKLPQRKYNFKTMPMTVAEVIGFESCADKTGKRVLGGFILPEFQRQRVWTQEQNVSLIEAIYEGFNFGSYAIILKDGAGCDNSEYDGLLLDGQQRISAILDYVNNKFPVFGFLYKDLTPADRLRFKMTIFPRIILATEDEAVMRDYYNRMNFSGVRHTEEERA